MADWAAFASVTGVVTLLVLLLAHASQSLVTGGSAPDAGGSGSVSASPSATESESSSTSSTESSSTSSTEFAPTPESPWEDSAFEPALDAIEAPADGSSAREDDDSPASAGDGSTAGEPSHVAVTDGLDRSSNRPRDPSLDDFSTSTLLANVAATQGFFALFLLGGVWYAQVPLSALGVAWPSPADLGIGVGLGLVLFGANQAAVSAGRRFDVGGGEQLRTALAPESLAGWALLLLVVLPVVAGFEELLFRGALVGGLGAGFAVSPWLLVVLSSVAFALGHGAQGRAGVVVTGVMGLVFAGAFVWTGSLVVVVVAHYLVNALEFVVHEGSGGFW